MKKRLLSSLLALCLMLALVPGTALAAGDSGGKTSGGSEAALPKLPTPKNLRWNKDGWIYWNIEDNSETKFRFALYREGESEPVRTSQGQPADGEFRTSFSLSDFADNCEVFGSGTYYFTVQSVGDGVHSADSEIAASPKFVYAVPSQKLEAPSSDSLVWKWPYATWTPLTDSEKVLMYNVEVYYSKTEGGKPVRAMGFGNPSNLSGSHRIDSIASDYGEGYYYFRVHTESKDIGTISTSDWSEFSPAYHYTGEDTRIKLSTPTDLRWDTEGDNSGFVYWSVNGSTQNNFQISYYRKGESTPVYQTRTNGHSDRRFPLFLHEYGSGTYYFTVQNLGDGQRYTDSDIATSSTWEYMVPAQQLGQVSGLAWGDWPNISWTPLANTDDVYGYHVETYYSATVDGQMNRVESFSGPGTQGVEYIRDHTIQRYGYGCYAFRVRALSKDITALRNGEWSAMSPVYHWTVDSSVVNDKLTEIVQVQDTLSPAQVKEAVKKLDTGGLREAMTADHNNEGTTALISQLEQKAGGPAEVVPVPGFSGLDTSKTTIIGANLNTTGENKTTLNIGHAQANHVLPENLESSLAVKFSMGLDGVSGTLQVPVKINLPIPASITPSFLVLLHYHQDGSYERVFPYVYYSGGQAYASFVLTSFSDFILTEEVREDVENYLFVPTVTGGTVVVTKRNAQPGDWVNIYVTPDEGWRLESLTVTDLRGWPVTVREMGENAFSFTMPNARVNVNPVFVKVEEENDPYSTAVPNIEGSSPNYGNVVLNPTAMNYSDVSAADWFYEAVRFCHQRYLMNKTGEAEGKFEPNAPATRAAVWTALSRAAGRNTITQGDNWYDRAQIWAKGKGITDGEDPMGTITREQLVTMLWRYNGNKYVQADNLSRFNDSASVSWWAAEAVNWAVAAGIINGSNGGLNPQGSATRAEVASILSRFCQFAG